MNYQKRIGLARQKHPEVFPQGLLDCCVQHDDWCSILSGGECNCVPDVTVTTPVGKYSVNRKGVCKKLGAEAETIPTVWDPRRSHSN
jgi:hypothetical protein